MPFASPDLLLTSIFVGSSGNDNTGGPRRVTYEEREREEREMRVEYKSAFTPLSLSSN